MKTLQLLAMLLVTFSSIPFMAQLLGTSAQPSASASVMGSPAGAATSPYPGGVKANDPAAVQPQQLRPVPGELQGALDSKSAMAGDRVVLKTEQSMKTTDGFVIPKGSRLIGHVTEVQSRDSARPTSQLGIVFDHAQFRGGRTLAIQSMIEAVQPSREELATRAMENEDARATQTGPAMNGGGHIGIGGVPGANVGGVADPAGQPGGNRDRTAAGDTGGAIRGASSHTASPGEHITGIPGVVLNSSTSGSVSGTLLTTKMNVHLDTGTQMIIGIAAAPRQ